MTQAHDYGPVMLDDDGVLHCPRCDGNYTHHGAVRAFVRSREDGDGTITEVDGLRSSTRYAASGELPHRRDTLHVRIVCELCDVTRAPDGSASLSEPAIASGGGLVLEIEQHKGQTILRWLSADAAR